MTGEQRERIGLEAENSAQNEHVRGFGVHEHSDMNPTKEGMH